MNVSIIGGTGHIGKNLTKMLVEAGHEVTVVASGRTPAPEGGVWERVRRVHQEYGVEGWTDTIRDLKAEAIVDLLQGNSPGLYEAVKATCEHFVVCGSVWMFGLPRVVPTPDETQGPCPFDGYARRYAQMLETRSRATAEGRAFTAVMPPNICGPYKVPLDCKGGRDVEVHRSCQRGQPVILPEPGSTLIGPCDAEDVARGFFCALQNRERAAGEVFNVGSAYALTSIQFVETYGDLFGVKIPIEFVSWRKFEEEVLPDVGAHWHFKANMCPDITKISQRIGYQPAFTPEQTMERAVKWLVDQRLL